MPLPAELDSPRIQAEPHVAGRSKRAGQPGSAAAVAPLTSTTSRSRCPAWFATW
jgi:hypothetical protein